MYKIIYYATIDPIYSVLHIIPHAQTSRGRSKKSKIEKQLVLLALMIFAVGDNDVLHARAFFLCYPFESTNTSSNLLNFISMWYYCRWAKYVYHLPQNILTHLQSFSFRVLSDLFYLIRQSVNIDLMTRHRFHESIIVTNGVM